MTGVRRVVTVVGNRPQLIKAAGVSAHLRAVGEEILVHTGQHYDPELSQVFFDELGLAPPDHLLGIGSGTHAEQTGAVMRGLEPLLPTLAPDALLVYGDTNSTIGAALMAAKAGIPLAHVEAGMRSFDRTTPEEVNRVVTDALAGLRLCSTETAVDNLRREGLDGGAALVGDVMADVALAFGPVADRRSDVLERLDLQPKGYLLATVHRAENVDDPRRLEAVIEILARASEVAPVVFAVHPRTRDRLATMPGADGLPSRGILTVEPLGYLDMSRLLRSARAALTDSGGLQKEAFLASTPCVTLRDRTEWVETVESGWNRLVGLDPERAVGALEDLPGEDTGSSPAAEYYGGGGAGERVAAAIADWLG